MPGTNQGGGPWGQGPTSGPPKPPNLEDLLRRGQDRFRGVMKGGRRGRLGLLLVALVVASIWLLSGFYRVQPDEQGVVLRFGEWVKTTQPGLNYHLPWPLESAVTPKVTRVNRVNVGFRTVADRGRGASTRDLPEESLMLTGDENIVDIDFQVFWLIRDAGKYLFNVERPQVTVKAVAESAMREVVGRTLIQRALSEGRNEVEEETLALTQEVLDAYGTGILVTQVKLQKVDPPGAVIDSFRDVQRARADLERAKNEAEAYANDIIPRAQGEAQKMEQEAKAYKEETVAEATGDAQRFLSVYAEYAEAKDVTTLRIYLETMESVLGGMNKVIIDSQGGGSGVVPYLPLPEIQKRRGEQQ
jgi:membrane protease subunit HflK